MAFVPLTVLSFSMTAYMAADVQATTGIVKDNTGTPIDFTTWDSLALEILPTASTPNSSSVVVAGACTGLSTGAINVKVPANTFSNASQGPGSAQLRITGKPASGDNPQMVCQGSLTLVLG